MNVTLYSEFIIVGVPVLQEHYIPLFIIFLIIFLATFLGNLLVVVLVGLDHLLHTPMYFFLWNLAVIDVLLTVTIIPKLLVVLSGHERTISFASCFAQMYCFISFAAVEVFLVAVMAYDRYVPIVKPLHYNTIMSSKVCFTMTVWVLVYIPVPFVLWSYFRIVWSVIKMKTVESHKKAFSMCSSHMAVVFLCYASGTLVYVGLRVKKTIT
ncbi:olfactory receptor 2D3-like [Lepisosteus oculatus]|uniref:olfactory receptor 2D3-like n=1 Tax=Lepisosteus oculatus TaxID=7918 RepID=UPI0035F505F9